MTLDRIVAKLVPERSFLALRTPRLTSTNRYDLRGSSTGRVLTLPTARVSASTTSVICLDHDAMGAPPDALYVYRTQPHPEHPPARDIRRTPISPDHRFSITV